jgi:hypothetical protein
MFVINPFSQTLLKRLDISIENTSNFQDLHRRCEKFVQVHVGDLFVFV